eukprot:scaffold45679_cov168-Skeletonema_marinoi.AAC.1
MPLASEYMNQLQPSLRMPSNNIPILSNSFVMTVSKLKTIGYRALYFCPSLKLVQIPGVIEIMAEAFAGCPLTHVTFGDKLERIRKAAFRSCKSLKSITIPLKEDMLGIVEMPFYDCDKLERVDIVESLHKAIAAFQFEEWTDDMNLEVLPMING